MLFRFCKRDSFVELKLSLHVLCHFAFLLLNVTKKPSPSSRQEIFEDFCGPTSSIKLFKYLPKSDILHLDLSSLNQLDKQVFP